MADNGTENKTNDALKDATNSILNISNVFDNMMKSLVPQGTVKHITIEIIEKKGFFGFGRKVKRVKANAYISLNNILNIDFEDKQEMKKYYDNLK